MPKVTVSSLKKENDSLKDEIPPLNEIRKSYSSPSNDTIHKSPVMAANNQVNNLLV